MKTLPTFEELQQPLHPLSPKGLYYAFLRLLLHSLGNLSDGIRTGNTYGYDSGVMLDYVYANRAGGRLGIGKLIDRVYLDSVGWKGIRARRALLTRCLTRAVQAQLEHKPRVRYLDIACGGGAYDIDVLKQFSPSQIAAELRDYRTENIEKARQNAASAGLQGIQFRQADAFDPASYQDHWDLVVSSGFWEIIEDNAKIQRCLHNIALCLERGGILIFTIQPYHPQLELAARALTSHAGGLWTMRLRSLALFQDWLAQAGFTYVSHQMEDSGIFGVVEARRA